MTLEAFYTIFHDGPNSYIEPNPNGNLLHIVDLPNEKITNEYNSDQLRVISSEAGRELGSILADYTVAEQLDLNVIKGLVSFNKIDSEFSPVDEENPAISIPYYLHALNRVLSKLFEYINKITKLEAQGLAPNPIFRAFVDLLKNDVLIPFVREMKAAGIINEDLFIQTFTRVPLANIDTQAVLIARASAEPELGIKDYSNEFKAACIAVMKEVFGEDWQQ